MMSCHVILVLQIAYQLWFVRDPHELMQVIPRREICLGVPCLSRFISLSEVGVSRKKPFDRITQDRDQVVAYLARDLKADVTAERVVPRIISGIPFRFEPLRMETNPISLRRAKRIAQRGSRRFRDMHLHDPVRKSFKLTIVSRCGQSQPPVVRRQGRAQCGECLIGAAHVHRQSHQSRHVRVAETRIEEFPGRRR